MKTPLHRLRTRAAGGFTLIEILAAMTVLVFLVLMLTQVYTEGAKAWQTGSRNTYRNMHARAVMDFMARELSMAAFEFGDKPDKQFLGMAYNANVVRGNFGLEGADEIFFVRLNREPNTATRRSSQLIRYYVGNYLDAQGNPVTNAPVNPTYRFRLMRDQFNPEAFNVYESISDDIFVNQGLWWMGHNKSRRILPSLQNEMIPNVRTFEVFVYTNELGQSSSDWRSFNTNDFNRLTFLDIYLETFDEADATRAAELANNLGQNNRSVVDFVERAVKRNYRRVYLYNKQGYQDSW